MTINFSFNIALLITGVIIGGFTAALLLFTNANRKANVYLALLVLICVGSLFHNFLLDAGIFKQQPNLYFIPVILSLGIGPLLYLYVNRLIGLKVVKRSSVWLHLIPVTIQFLFFLISFLQNADRKYDIWKQLYKPYVSPLQNLAVYISVSIYVYLSFKEIDFYKKQLNYFYSNPALNLAMVKAIVICFYLLLSPLYIFCIDLLLIPDFRKLFPQRSYPLFHHLPYRLFCAAAKQPHQHTEKYTVGTE